MDLSTGLSVAMLIFATAFGIYVVHAEQELRKLKKRARYLNERLEAVEKFSGLNQTNTDIRIMGK